MDSFPLFALPCLPRLHVLNKMEIKDLFIFSTISKKTKILTKMLNFNVETLSLDLDEACDHTIYLHQGLQINIFNDKPFCFPKPQNEIVLNGTTFKLHNFDSFEILDPHHPELHYTDVAEQFTKYILEIFRIQKFKLTTYIYELESLFVWKYTKTFEYFRDSPPSPSADRFRFALEQLSIRELDIFDGGFDYEHFNYEGPLTMEKLYIEDGGWFTMNNIKTMSCKTVWLGTTYIPSECNYIIKLWLEGECLKNLEMFRVFYEGEPAEILQGITTFPWNANNRPAMFGEDDVSEGVDIRRADGMLATVTTAPVCGNKRFTFYIWHSKLLSQ